MHILVIHFSNQKKDRKTISDSLYCYKRYVKGHSFHYLNLQKPQDLSDALVAMPWDGVIFHYTFLALRFNLALWRPLYEGTKDKLRALTGVKVIIPQDEYHCTGLMRELCRYCGVSHIFTCASGFDFDTFYPAGETGGATVSQVFTGYVDDRSRGLIERLVKKQKTRRWDIGYRARKLKYWHGRSGQWKIEIAERVREKLPGYPGLKTDILTTGEKGENALYGNDWIKFVLNCRTMLGCLGGSDLMDVDGSIMDRVDAYMAEHPDSTFDEVADACFPGMDGNIHLYALSPRHFECAMTRTCQLLLEGDYFGVFEPNVHFIEIKKDYSNLDEVLEKVQDQEYCERIAQRCYEDVAAKRGRENPNTYAWFAWHIVDWIAGHQPARQGSAGAFPVVACWWNCGPRLALARSRERFALWRKNQLYRLYDFSARHPGLGRLIRKLTGRGQNTDGQGD